MSAWQLRIAALGTVAFCLWAKFSTGGWLMLVGFLVYPLIGLAHFLYHSRAIQADGVLQRPTKILIAVSHFFLLAAFLLQVDGGDGPSWLTLLAFFGEGAGSYSRRPPNWWPNLLIMNLLTFVPTFVTWRLLKKAAKPSGLQPPIHSNESNSTGE